MRSRPDKFDLVYAVVAGRGAFPFDMLRYDACRPFRGEDAALLEREDGSRAIIVVRYAGQAGEWTEGRWSSFLWGLRRFEDQGAAQNWARELNASFNPTKEASRG